MRETEGSTILYSPFFTLLIMRTFQFGASVLIIACMLMPISAGAATNTKDQKSRCQQIAKIGGLAEEAQALRKYNEDVGRIYDDYEQDLDGLRDIESLSTMKEKLKNLQKTLREDLKKAKDRLTKDKKQAKDDARRERDRCK